jgi:subtilisin
VKKQHIPTLTTSALGFIAICVIVAGVWDMFPVARSQTTAPQEQAPAVGLSAAVEAQRKAAAKLTRSASFDERYRKLSDKARKKATVPVIVRVRAPFQPDGQMMSAAERLAQRKVIEEAQDRLLAGLSYVPSSLKRYEDIPYVAVRVNSSGLEQLQASAEALNLFEDTAMKLATAESLPLTGATRSWEGGYMGAGKTVVILDSGVDKTHPTIANMPNKVVAEACFSTNAANGYTSLCPNNAKTSTAVDSGKHCEAIPGLNGCGHGTHIAGIAAGRSGVAINANVISIQVMSYVVDNPDECGFGNCLRSLTSDVMDALQHVYDNLRTPPYDIATVNISLVTDITGEYTSPCDLGDGAPLKAKIDQLKSVGIATVVAAGNDGFTNALGYPACISTAVSVGAVGDGGAAVPADAVWQNSNSASYLDLLAPGVEIKSAIPGGGVMGGVGTSQAAAHVSGALAMLNQQQRATNADEVDALVNKLTTSGVNVIDSRNGRTKPRIKIDDALGVNIPPDNWIGEYYNNRNLEGNPAHTQNDGGDDFIDRNFTGVSPAPGVGAENYSIRWTRPVTLTGGTWRFSVTCDDGCRLYVDDQEKVNEWRDQPATTYNADVFLEPGVHVVRLEYYQFTGPAQVRLIWGPLDPICSQTVVADRWRGEYFNNSNLEGSPSMIRDDGIDSLIFNWEDGGPSSICKVFKDYFSARWTQTVNLGAGKYRFTVTGDNGVRLWVNDQKLIDRWADTVGTNTADVQLPLGDQRIRLEYFENVGDAAVSLSWAQLPPDPPSNLVASAASLTQIDLSWVDNSSFEDGFKIERWNGGSYSQIKTVGRDVTTYSDPGLTPSTTYRYRIRAFNSSGNSGYSNESSATTPSCSYSISPAGKLLEYVGGSFTVNVTAAPVCSWTAVSNNAWIRVTSGSSGAGNGVVRVEVGEWGGSTQRTGSLTIAGKSFGVTQRPCHLSPGGNCL